VRPDELDATGDSERPGAQRVAHDNRHRPPYVGKLVQQRERAADEVPSARDSGRSHEHEATHSRRRFRGELRRDDAAERMADEVHALETYRVEEARNPPAQVGPGHVPCKGWKIDGEEMPARPERLDQRRPPP
jgi:hypothetical protein